MNTATQPISYNAKQLDASKRKQLALAAMAKLQPLTEMAEENKVSRKFIYQQRGKAMGAVNEAFAPDEKSQEKILFYLPVTFSWLRYLSIQLSLLFLSCQLKFVVVFLFVF